MAIMTSAPEGINCRTIFRFGASIQPKDLVGPGPDSGASPTGPKLTFHPDQAAASHYRNRRNICVTRKPYNFR